ncbi:glycoside hydrolase family 3 protein [Paenibacillus nanensis]|nr:glycoside hydrolase family 3 N-terminal domain-containing protein [Paenibacillus nanensis]
MRKTLDQMTLEEKVGQLFTFYYKETVYAEEAEQYIAGYKAGGIFLDMECLEEPEQVHKLTSRMQEASLTRGSGLPLFVAADFVAGAGCKLSRGGAVHFPKNMAIGAANDERLAYESGKATADESLAMGVNFNYSPVVDINNNPDNPVIGTHSFGGSRELVSRMGAAVIRGYQERGMIATAKHFPGHGDTNVDSHLDLPVLPFDRDRLEAFELVPFRKAIEAGVDAIMVGHIAVPALDPGMLPASLSRPMVTGLLREELGFDGLVVTDGMSMKGVTSKYTQAKACVMALQAGADILLVCPERGDEAQEMVDAVLGAVKSGKLSESRIDESAARIMQMKEKYGLTPDRFKLQPYEASAFEQEEAKLVSLELARKALRASGSEELWAGVLSGVTNWMLIGEKQLAEFAVRLSDSGIVTEVRQIGTYEELQEVLAETPGERPVIAAVTHNKRMKRDALERVNRIASERGGPMLLVHFGSPYDIEGLPDLPVILLYDRAPSLQEAAAEYVNNVLHQHDGRDRYDA